MWLGAEQATGGEIEDRESKLAVPGGFNGVAEKALITVATPQESHHLPDDNLLLEALTDSLGIVLHHSHQHSSAFGNIGTYLAARVLLPLGVCGCLPDRSFRLRILSHLTLSPLTLPTICYLSLALRGRLPRS